MEQSDGKGRILRVLRISVRVLFAAILFLTLGVAGLHRFAAVLLLLAAFVLYLTSFWRSTFRAALVLGSLAIGSLFSPVDICSPYDRGLSHTAAKIKVLPLVLGLPTKETAEKAQRGEIVIGGCIVSGRDPKYVVTW